MTIVTLVIPDELLPLLVSPEWIEERKRRWGVTSPIYQSKVLGEFPDVSDDTPDPAEVDRGGTGRGCCHVLVDRSLLQRSPALVRTRQ
jgi:hypothetical protein